MRKAAGPLAFFATSCVPCLRERGGLMRRRVWWLTVLTVVVIALAVGASGSGGDGGPAARASRLSKEVRCPSCRALSAAESDATAARAVRAEIRTRIAGGESDDEIRGYLASRYGADILLTREGTGPTVRVWALRGVALVLGAAGLVLAFRRWTAAGA